MACWKKKPHIYRWIPKEPSETAKFHSVVFSNDDWYFIDILDVHRIRDLLTFKGHGILDVTVYEMRYNEHENKLFERLFAGVSKGNLSISVGTICIIGKERSECLVVENSAYKKSG